MFVSIYTKAELLWLFEVDILSFEKEWSLERSTWGRRDGDGKNT